MIAIINNSFIDSKCVAFFRAYLVTILKALVKAFDLVDFNIVPVKKNIATLSNALWLNVPPDNSRSNYLISSKKTHRYQ